MTCNDCIHKSVCFFLVSLDLKDYADKCGYHQPDRPEGYWVKWYEKHESERSTAYEPQCQCSICDYKFEPYTCFFINYCPNCGAKIIGTKMRGDADNEDKQ